MFRYMASQSMHSAGSRTADILATTSVAGASIAWVTELNTWLQAGAGAVAILAGLSAAIYHMYKIHDLRQQRRGLTGRRKADPDD